MRTIVLDYFLELKLYNLFVGELNKNFNLPFLFYDFIGIEEKNIIRFYLILEGIHVYLNFKKK